MPDAINNGGPAYPVTAGQQVYSTGMSLRDAAALAALPPLVTYIMPNATPDVADKIARMAAVAAYEFADAFIAAREARS